MSAITHGPVEDYLLRDHERLDGLLGQAMAAPAVAEGPYEAFRGGLLRHIGIEEKILVPAARARLPAEALSVVRQLRLDHGALAALLVPSPTRPILERVQAVLLQHNPLEEGEGGLYRTCVRLAAIGEDDLLARIEAAPQVPLAAHYDGPRAFESIDRLLSLAGRIPP